MVRFKLDSDNDLLTAEISGDIDHHSAKEIRREIDAAIDKYLPAMLEVGLSGVDFMDSSGIGLILGRFRKQEKHGGSMSVFCTAERIYRILCLTGADKLMKIECAGKREGSVK